MKTVDQDIVSKKTHQILRSALWDIEYHQRGFATERDKAVALRSIIEAADYDISDEHAGEIFEEYGDDDVPDNAKDLLARLLGDCLSAISHHERCLLEAGKALAATRIILTRAGYELDEDAIRAEVKHSLER